MRKESKNVRRHNPIQGTAHVLNPEPTSLSDLGLVPKDERLPEQTFTPYGQGMILKILKFGETKAGLVLPDTMQVDASLEAPHALVVACGPECKQVKRGNRILLFSGTPAGRLQYRGELFHLVREDCIIGVVDEPPEVIRRRLDDAKPAAFDPLAQAMVEDALKKVSPEGVDKALDKVERHGDGLPKLSKESEDFLND